MTTPELLENIPMHKEVCLLEDPIMFRFKGFINLSKLYNDAVSFLKQREFTLYEKKHKDKPDLLYKEVDIKLRAERKESEYVLDIIEVEIHINEFEAQNKSGEVAGKGLLEVTITPCLHLDYLGRFKSSGLRKFFGSIYHWFMNKEVLEKSAKPLVNTCLQLLEVFKRDLGLAASIEA